MAILGGLVASLTPLNSLQAQQAPQTGWDSQPAPAAAPRGAAPSNNTTTLQRNAIAGRTGETDQLDSKARLAVAARLTADGQQIDRDLVWRVFQAPRTSTELPQLVTTTRTSTPEFRLPPGDYLVNVAFGRAHLTRTISLNKDDQKIEMFVLNAGGLRIKALVGNRPVDPKTINYRIFEAERDQSGNRRLVMDRAQAGLIIRLNSGIYHIVSKYGDANARIRADVTVEAGKLTEATIAHAAATVAFKLVDRPGGEALPGTYWKIETPDGDLVKRSVGALPSHILAPGEYIVTARSSGQIYKRRFSIDNGQVAQVEVVRQ